MAQEDFTKKLVDPYFTGQWLRRASDMEKIMEELHRNEHRLWYQLNLSCLNPLQEEHVRKALNHLYRKTPCLGATFGEKNGELWLRMATNPTIDFKVIKEKTVEEVQESLHNHHFDLEEGPLFCARLLEASSNDTTEPEDIEPTFPYKYNLLFGLHHGLVDGTACLYVMNFFINLLNDVIAGIPIDNKPLGSFVSGEITETLVREKLQLIESDSQLEQQLARDHKIRKTETPLTIKTFPRPNMGAQTRSYFNVLDASTSSKFIQRCKQEQITVNSAFTALANVATVDILLEYGLELDSYVIHNFHAVNMRQFWDTPIQNALGCHMSYPLLSFIDTPKDIGDEFWTYAKQVNRSLREDIASGKMLAIDAYKTLLPDDSIPSETEGKLELEGDYITSNLGDFTDIVSKGGDHVRITNVVRSTAIHTSHISLLYKYQTYRDRFMLFVDYNTEAIEGSVVEKLMNQVLNRLRKSIHYV